MRATIAIATAGAVAFTAAAPSVSAWRAPIGGERLLLAFDQGESLTSGTSVTDVSGNGNHGTVLSGYGGQITPIDGGASFPGVCWREPCPNAMIEIADSPTLDPGTAAFEYGANILLRSDQTADGENVLQKGRWGDAGGQWKLQVDKSGGRPSCVVSGFRNGREQRVLVRASVGVADGRWHTVVCRRAAGKVTILVDGRARGSASMPDVDLNSTATVTVGAKDVGSRDNDQFHGRLDQVFMRMI